MIERSKQIHSRRKEAVGMNGNRMPRVVQFWLFALMFSLCFEGYAPWGDASSLTVSKAAGVMLSMVSFWRWQNVFVKTHSTVWSLFWLWVVLATSTLLGGHDNVSMSATMEPLITLGQCFVLFWICTNIFRDRVTAAYGLVVFAAGAAIMGTLMVIGIGRSTLGEGSYARMTFMGTNPNALAMYMTVAIIAILGVFLANVLPLGRWRYALLLLVVPVVVALPQMGSRGAIVSLSLGLACLLSAPLARARNGIAIWLVVLCTCVAFYHVSKNSILSQRIQLTVETGSMAGRQAIWQTVVGMIEEKPIRGWGMGGGRTFSVTYPLEGSDPHNAFLAFFLFGGLLSGIPFLCMSVWWLYATYCISRWCVWNTLPLALTVVILSTLSKGGGVYMYKIVWILLAFATAAIRDSSVGSISTRPKVWATKATGMRTQANMTPVQAKS
jgi:O-antigen ligase